MARIFISYSRADRLFIDQFVPLIRRVYGNDSMWFDDDIHGGVDWWQMILDEIAACDIFIYLISNESLKSPYCQAELREALRLKKQILPVTVRRLKEEYPGNINADLATVLRRTQYVDMSNGFHDPVTISTLYAALTHLLNAIPPQPTKPITLAQTPEPPVPDKKKPDPTICATYIGGCFVLIATVIAGIFVLWQGVFANNNFDLHSTFQVTQNTTEIPTASPPTTETETIVPSHTPTALPTTQPIQSATELFAHETHVAKLLLEEFSSVDHNKDWIPIEHDFDGVTMVLVPMGIFDLYTDPQTYEQIKMQYVYWIDKTEVSNQAYQTCVAKGDCATFNLQGSPQKPVVNVTWEQAANFCEMRGARLPTEAEWVYAASGPDSEIDAIPPKTVYNSMSLHDVAVEGDISWVGALHMRGNVREWTVTPDRDNPDKAIVRGASYINGKEMVYLSYQAQREKTEGFQNIGFRCVIGIHLGGTTP